MSKYTKHHETCSVWLMSWLYYFLNNCIAAVEYYPLRLIIFKSIIVYYYSTGNLCHRPKH